MATPGKGKGVQDGLPPMSDCGVRAAAALNKMLPGPHADKRVARLFNVSLRMAKYLRAGRYWTAARLSQANEVLGDKFAQLLAPPTAAQLHQQMDVLEAELADLHKQLLTRGDEDERGAPSLRMAARESGVNDNLVRPADRSGRE